MDRILGRPAMETRGAEISSSFDDAPAMETDGNSVAMDCLRAAVDASGLPQKALAGDRSVPQFNKLLSGRHGSKFPVEGLDELPPDVTDDFVMRYGESRGLVVRKPTREEDLDRQAQLLHEATRLVKALTAEHLRHQMRRSR